MYGAHPQTMEQKFMSAFVDLRNQTNAIITFGLWHCSDFFSFAAVVHLY